MVGKIVGGKRRELVGALVEHHVDAHPADGAVVVVRGLDVEALLARLARRLQVLDPVLDPLHRAARGAPGRAHRDVLAADVRLLPERPADVAAAHVEAVRGHAEQVGDEEAQRVRVLVGRVVGELAGVGVVVDEAGAPFERHVALAVLREAPACHVRGGRANCPSDRRRSSALRT